MKKLRFIGFLLILSPVIWAQIKGRDYQDVKEESPLVEAYYAVGKQYETRGKKTKGASFKNRAQTMDSSYSPAAEVGSQSIKLASRTEAEKDTHFNTRSTYSQTVSAHPMPSRRLVGDEQTQIKIVRLQFDRLVRGILSENLSVLENLLAPIVELNDQELEKSDLMAGFEHVFAGTNLAELSFKDLYATDLKDVKVSLDSKGGIVKLEAHEQEDLKCLPFWKKNQEFHFSRQNGKWFLVKIIAKG